MGYFTLDINLNELTGQDCTRVTVGRVAVSHLIAEDEFTYALESQVTFTGGTASVSLPADGIPSGYTFSLTVYQLGLVWTFPAGVTDASYSLTDIAEGPSLARPRVS